MSTELNASEKRLIAALDRIDQFIDRVAAEAASAPGMDAGSDTHDGAAAALATMQAENARQAGEIAALHDRQAEIAAQFEARLAAANARLAAAGQEAARLSAANEALAQANRVMISGSDVGAGEAQRAALEAEIESLRAARAAEIAQMGDVIEALDQMLGSSSGQNAAPSAEAGGAPAPVGAQPETALAAEGGYAAAQGAENGAVPPAMIETPMPPAAGQSADAGEDDADEGDAHDGAGDYGAGVTLPGDAAEQRS